ncbi:DUF484 family protein [Emcibacter sp. SYSU 3D8]|uniref:DUF484 family protein n=1 Tax=Emcibacter sp. SYSU 3D8 TaxID=3133969 RepID=UPI0031FF3005
MAGGKLTKDQVLAWLDKHPDVLAGLLPGGPENDQGVVDFQRHLIDRLRGSLSQRTADRDALVETSRGNLASQHQVHEATLGVIRAGCFDELAWFISRELHGYLHVDVAVLCLDHRSVWPERKMDSVLLLPAMLLESQFAPGQTVTLGPLRNESEEFFGPATSLIKSQAMVKLELGATMFGVLALGDRDAATFEPGHATQLVRYMGDVLALRLQQLLPQSQAPEAARWSRPEN